MIYNLLKTSFIIILLFQVNITIYGQPLDYLYADVTAIELIKTRPNEIIVGSEAGIAKSIDFGNTWTEASFNTKPAWVDDISFDQNNPDIGYAAGGGRLYKTADGGFSWLSVDQLDEVYLVDVNPYKSNVIFAQKAGDTGWGPHFLYRSTDSGLNWIESDITGFIRDIHFSPLDDSLVYGRYDYEMLRSKDLGNSWEVMRRTSNGIFSSLSIENTIIYISEIGLLFKSSDSGNSWENIGAMLQSLDHSFYIRSILPDQNEPNKVYVATKEGLFLTKDNGSNWNKIYNGSVFLMKADHDFPRNIYLLGSSLMRIVDTIQVTGINQNPSYIHLRFSLNQNFPNPFNPLTNISYLLPEKSFVTIQVYDLLGKKVAELVNSIKKSGTHSVTFNGFSFASGTYIVNMKAGNYRQSRKILLIK